MNHILHGLVHSFRKFIINCIFSHTAQLLQIFMALTLISIDTTAEQEPYCWVGGFNLVKWGLKLCLECLTLCGCLRQGGLITVILPHKCQSQHAEGGTLLSRALAHADKQHREHRSVFDSHMFHLLLTWGRCVFRRADSAPHVRETHSFEKDDEGSWDQQTHIMF